MKQKRYTAHSLSKKGLSPMEQLRIRQNANKLSRHLEQQAFNKMLVIPLMAYIEGYKRKPSKDKLEEFFIRMMDLFEDFGEEEYTIEDAKKYLKETCGDEIVEFIESKVG